MDYIKSNENHNSIGIKSFKVMSNKRKRRCLNYQITFFGTESRHHYDMPICKIVIPCINYRYYYQ